MMDKNKFRVGEVVYLKKYQMLGEIVGIRKDQYEFQAGSLTFLVTGDELEVANRQVVTDYEREKKQHAKNKEQELRKYYRPREFRVDLHGYTVEQAIIAINDIIEEAKLYRAHHAFIVHGKGTGTLRLMVQRMLRDYKESGVIIDFEYASVFDGGHGVTIIYF